MSTNLSHLSFRRDRPGDVFHHGVTVTSNSVKFRSNDYKEDRAMIGHGLARRVWMTLNNFSPKILGCGSSDSVCEITMASGRAFIMPRVIKPYGGCEWLNYPLSADGLLASEFKHQSRFGHERPIPSPGAIRIIPVWRLSLRKMYTYVVPIERIEQAFRQTEGDLLNLFGSGVPVCGGVFPLETLEWLARNVIGVSRVLESAPTECDTGLICARLHAEFARWLAQATSESLLDAGACWARQDHWVLSQTNPMDLAGALLEMGAICAFAHRAGVTVWVYWVGTELGRLTDAPPD